MTTNSGHADAADSCESLPPIPSDGTSSTTFDAAPSDTSDGSVLPGDTPVSGSATSVTSAVTSAASDTSDSPTGVQGDQPEKRGSIGLAAGLTVGLSLLVSLMLLAFLAPSMNSGPDNLPLAVGGNEQATQQLVDSLEQQRPGAFDIHRYSTVDEARDAIRHREAIGGIAVDEGGIHILQATGAGSQYKALLTQLGSGIEKQIAEKKTEALTAQLTALQSGAHSTDVSAGAVGATNPAANPHAPNVSASQSQQVQAAQDVEEARGTQAAQATTKQEQAQASSAAQTVSYEDLAPGTTDDPNGIGISITALPLAFGGIFSAAILTLLLKKRSWGRVITSVAFSLVAGLSVAAIMVYGYHNFDCNFWALALLISVSIAATSLAILGLEQLFGFAGLGIGALTTIFIANPLSGIATGWQWLPSPWGAFGQYLPLGAAGTAIRSLVYFDGAAMGHPLTVLLCWIAAGVLLVWIASARKKAVAVKAR